MSAPVRVVILCVDGSMKAHDATTFTRGHLEGKASQKGEGYRLFFTQKGSQPENKWTPDMRIKGDIILMTKRGTTVEDVKAVVKDFMATCVWLRASDHTSYLMGTVEPSPEWLFHPDSSISVHTPEEDIEPSSVTVRLAAQKVAILSTENPFTSLLDPNCVGFDTVSIRDTLGHLIDTPTASAAFREAQGGLWYVCHLDDEKCEIGTGITPELFRELFGVEKVYSLVDDVYGVVSKSGKIGAVYKKIHDTPMIMRPDKIVAAMKLLRIEYTFFLYHTSEYLVWFVINT